VINLVVNFPRLRIDNMELSTAKIADIIEGFLLKKDGPWDWDDFISIRLSDPKTEEIRKICANLTRQY
jgi:hypothetical protein